MEHTQIDKITGLNGLRPIDKKARGSRDVP